MHIWYQYNVTKSHKIIKYHPVSPGCHPLVIPPCTQVMNIYVIPLICTCRFPGQVMPLQQPSAGVWTGLGVPSAGDNVPEQGTSPEQGHHNPWNNGLQFQDLAFQALAIELHQIQFQDLAFQALAIELRLGVPGLGNWIKTSTSIPRLGIPGLGNWIRIRSKKRVKQKSVS